MAGKILFDDNDDFADIDIDEYGGIRNKDEYEVIVKKCLCGYRGELLPDIGGFCCASCGYLLIEE
jgi:hypothetical protein